MKSKLCFGDLFGQLKPEKRVEIVKPKVKRNKNLERIIQNYKSFIEEAVIYDEQESLYQELELEPVSSKNIVEFSLCLDSYQRLDNFYLSGYFISRLINESSDKEFTIHTNYFDSLIDAIGYRNEKHITINGNVGNWVGDRMKSGEITINGNVGCRVGWYIENGIIIINGNSGGEVGRGMKNGKITINGNARDWVGEYMEKGSIIVQGNVGANVGRFMSGGNIIVKGNASDELGSFMSGGNIIVKGNASDELGSFMSGGDITVNGNAGDLVGKWIEGGEITVNGNAGYWVGDGMKDGEIYLNGEYKSLSEHIHGGNIYHKDKLIVEGGKRK